jgi:effector-binding domain-containing protein
MLDQPQIIQTTAQPIATLHFTIPRSEIQNVMGPGLQELMAAVAAQGLTPTGPWFTHHHQMEPDIFDFDIGLPLAKPFKATDRVKSGQWPAARMARTVYRGSYEGLGPAWGEFMEWIETAGHQSAPDLWERYLTGPESSPDPEKWSTELSRPLIS